jgi:hypothetical protein
MISDKIRPHHLERKAILYVRQSSAHRVLHTRHGLDAAVEHPVLMAFRKPDTAGGEATGQQALGALSPTDLSPFLSGQHRLGGNRRPVRNMVFAALSRFCDGEDQGDVGWVDVLAARQTHRPQQTALAQSLAERTA